MTHVFIRTAAWWLVAVFALLFTGCASVDTSRVALSPLHGTRADGADLAPMLPPARSGKGAYYQDDVPGAHPPPHLELVPDAVFTPEPVAKIHSRPYAVFGATYTPLPGKARNSQRGVASWYGSKFHGQRTASGERYDMYKMTAAHPTLPIPSYVRITNLDTGSHVVVRVNDRGPFIAGRLIDVSYTAALKLGMLKKGSQHVQVDRILESGSGAAAPGDITSLLPQDVTSSATSRFQP